jgi:2-methylfumaryl-CoA isomerase
MVVGLTARQWKGLLAATGLEAEMVALGIIGEVMINGDDRARHGNDLFGGFGRDFATADGRRIMVVGLTARQWKGLLAATGLEAEMVALGERLSLDLSDQGNRFTARDEIAALLAPWIGARGLAQCAEAFDANGVCWGPYQTFRELVENDPRCSTANPLFALVDQPGIGPLLMAGSPLAGEGLGRAAPRPAPRLGSDTDAVLSEVLGLSQGEIGKLHDAGVVAGP